MPKDFHLGRDPLEWMQEQHASDTEPPASPAADGDALERAVSATLHREVQVRELENWLDHFQVPCAVVSTKGQCLFANAALTQWLGLTADGFAPQAASLLERTREPSSGLELHQIHDQAGTAHLAHTVASPWPEVHNGPALLTVLLLPQAWFPHAREQTPGATSVARLLRLLRPQVRHGQSTTWLVQLRSARDLFQRLVLAEEPGWGESMDAQVLQTFDRACRATLAESMPDPGEAEEIWIPESQDPPVPTRWAVLLYAIVFDAVYTALQSPHTRAWGPVHLLGPCRWSRGWRIRLQARQNSSLSGFLGLLPQGSGVLSVLGHNVAALDGGLFTVEGQQMWELILQYTEEGYGQGQD